MAWVHANIYAAGGEHIPRAWEAFAETTGITAVVHVAIEHPCRFQGPLPARFLWLRTDAEPIDQNLRRLAGEFVRRSLEAGHKVLLHGREGRHRVRWVYVAYRLCAGARLEQALREASEKPWLAPYRTDRASWESFHRELQHAPPAAS